MARPSKQEKDALQEGLKWFDIKNYEKAYKNELTSPQSIIAQLWPRIMHLEMILKGQPFSEDPSVLAKWRTNEMADSWIQKIQSGQIILPSYTKENFYWYQKVQQGVKHEQEGLWAARKVSPHTVSRMYNHYFSLNSTKSDKSTLDAMTMLISMNYANRELARSSSYPLFEINLNAPEELIISELREEIRKLRDEKHQKNSTKKYLHAAKHFKSDNTLAVVDLLTWQEISGLSITIPLYADLLGVGESKIRDQVLPRAQSALDPAFLALASTALEQESKKEQE